MSHKRESSFTGQLDDETREKLTACGVEIEDQSKGFIIRTSDSQVLNNAFRILDGKEVNVAQDVDEDEVTAESIRAMTKKAALAFAESYGVEIDKALNREELLESIIQAMLPEDAKSGPDGTP